MAVWQTYVLPCIWAFLACGAFAVLFNIHGGGILICCGGGALGWLVYLLGTKALRWSDMAAALLAGIAIAAWSEIMARVRKCPVTGYLILAMFPLVPGGGIYYAMDFAIRGQAEEFARTLGHTLEFSGALALGVLLVSSAMRMWHTVRQRRERG